MASYCGKCGTELSPDKQFCASCGAPVAAGFAPVAPVASYQPVPPSPPPIAPYNPGVAAPPAVQPAASGSSTVKIVLIVVGVLVLLGILAVAGFGFFVWRVSRAIHVSGTGDHASVSIPGVMTANTTEKFSASDLGTDIYPGAQSEKGSVRMTLPTGSWLTAIYSTSDSKDQVVAYYKSKFGSESGVIDYGETAMLTLKKSDKELVTVTVSSKPNEDNGKTRIAIMHTTSTKP
jgi:nitrate reductase NapE component